MGRVFTAESIKQETFAQPGDQERAARSFMEAAVHLPDLHAATIFGSTALNQAKRRSDTDIAVAYREDSDLATFFTDLRDTIAAVPQGSLIETHIVSDRTLRDTTAALQGDVFMAEHLRLTAAHSIVPGIRAEAFAAMPDPLAELPPSEAGVLAEEVTARYLTNKIRKFFNAAQHGDDTTYHRLQRAFELPTAITRKLARLQALHSSRHSQAFSADFYDRRSLAHEAERISPAAESDWTRCSGWLIERDGEYSQLLEDTIAGTVSLADYQRWLNDISRPSFDYALKLSIAALALSASEA